MAFLDTPIVDVSSRNSEKSELNLKHFLNHKLLLPELAKIKKQYGISMQAIAYRLKDLGIITQSYFKQFMFFINQSGFSIEEPFAYEGQEKSSRFSQLLFRALGEELTSMSKAASLNNQKLAEFREKNLMIPSM